MPRAKFLASLGILQRRHPAGDREAVGETALLRAFISAIAARRSGTPVA
jgi:hypothetical protein